MDGGVETQLPHVVILSSPGMGLFIPLAEFTRQLILHHKFSATLITHIIPSLHHTQNTILANLPKTIQIISLPSPPSSQPIQADVRAETRISLTHKNSIQSLRDALKTLASTRQLVALIVDLFGTDAFDVAREFGVPSYIFYTSQLLTLTLYLHLPDLDLSEPVELPGCIPIEREDLYTTISYQCEENFKWYIHHGRRYKEAKGILVNSFEELEPETIRALRDEPSFPPIHLVGPLVQAGSGDGGVWCRWLDEQPRASVLLVSLGSGGVLSSEQMREMALGLEMSGVRFLWVVRTPNEEEARAIYFGVDVKGSEPLEFLPEGFLVRTRGVGHIVPWWVPQKGVLRHCSTGGFLSHCGWNSTLESMMHGVPMIAWPLYAEQQMNAALLVKDLKVALRPATSERRGLVRREEIARVIKELMGGEDQGMKVRKRMIRIKEACSRALAEGGSSNRTLLKVLSEWKREKDID